ncbi:hypothetical protein ACTG9Q_15380 [Actinokineospora sp. 24-640]
MSTSRKHIRRAAAAAMVPTALALAFGGNAHAATATAGGDVKVVQGVLVYLGSSADNEVEVLPFGSKIRVRDAAGITAGAGCRIVSAAANLAECTATSGLIAQLGSGDDVFTSEWATLGYVNGEDGADSFYAGVADGVSRIQYIGGRGANDVVVYHRAASGVAASLAPAYGKDTTGADGREGDLDTLAGDIEAIIGSVHRDSLFGNELANGLHGGAGRDRIFGNDGVDVINAQDGANDLYIDCGGRTDTPYGDKDIAIIDAADTTHRCETKRISGS